MTATELDKQKGTTHKTRNCYVETKKCKGLAKRNENTYKDISNTKLRQVMKRNLQTSRLIVNIVAKQIKARELNYQQFKIYQT